jgi:uncharacterized protein (TIGR02145 family)
MQNSLSISDFRKSSIMRFLKILSSAILVMIIGIVEVLAQTVSDIEGNVYNTVSIGTQVWMKENLKTTKFNDNTDIPLVTDENACAKLSTSAYCWYNNDAATHKASYGALYNWYVVNSGYNGDKKVCPTGWHIPTDTEWTILTTYLGGESVAGGKLKETGLTHWITPNTGATNETGFTALPGGYRLYYSGNFADNRIFDEWWSSSEFNTSSAWFRHLIYGGNGVSILGMDKRYGLSVRCLKD